MFKFLTGDRDKYQSNNPGNVNYSLLLHIYQGVRPAPMVVWPMVISLALTFLVSTWFSIIFFLVLIFFCAVHFVVYRLLCENYKKGDSNPGIVVSVNPTLVAVATNMRKIGGDYPVLNIHEEKYLKKVKVGDRVATISVYGEYKDKEVIYWKDVSPTSVPTITLNKKEIKRAVESYSEEEWTKLEDALAEIQAPYKVGLYRLRVHTSDWAGEEEVVES
ncbi:DUF3239 domain-containing protein [Flammeovirga aprica]|uniref:DUF3239 domain-containing protein n=1 Tax=Flammeovirga aprica JL-4 TaxID=694437 RepID=A0A7X9RZJ2_9BACT|nr:DUF3239 domain-containing protein [Flammeovirga aprica]NME71584.1 DUF3239 domain-containing protein [Flammeovirga aprica JL-4]